MASCPASGTDACPCDREGRSGRQTAGTRAGREHSTGESQSNRRGACVSAIGGPIPPDAGRNRACGREGSCNRGQLPAVVDAADRGAGRCGHWWAQHGARPRADRIARPAHAAQGRPRRPRARSVRSRNRSTRQEVVGAATAVTSTHRERRAHAGRRRAVARWRSVLECGFLGRVVVARSTSSSTRKKSSSACTSGSRPARQVRTRRNWNVAGDARASPGHRLVPFIATIQPDRSSIDRSF